MDYYDNGVNNTNLNNKSISKKNIIIVFVFVIVLLLIFLFYKKMARNNTYTINLLGSDAITMYAGDTYYEYGYLAKDINNKDVTSLVKVKNNVDFSKPGSYTIVYSINTFFKKNEIIRRVNIIEDPLKDVTFVLNGSNVVNINIGDSYQENGIVCSYLNNDCSSYVNISSNVDTNVVGTYTIKYKLLIGNKEKVLTRNINVIGDKYKITLSNEGMVNTDILINFKSQSQDYDYVLLPTGEKVTLKDAIYVAHENGIYRFTIYDKFGSFEEVPVVINNIDKIAPTGSCYGVISRDYRSTSFTIDAQDNSGKILKYVHTSFPSVDYTNNKFSINKKLENSYVRVYDEAFNNVTIECSIEYPQVIPTGKNIVKTYNSDTLKYVIAKNSDYYESYIWVKDAYNQLKTGIPSNFGTVATANDILSSEISRYSYQNKGVIGGNASGFVTNAFFTGLYHNNPAWLNTSVTPIVIYNGKVLRNFAGTQMIDTVFRTYGLKKDGYLGIYKFLKGNDISNNTKTSRKIIDDGIRYTFGFSPELVINGNVVVGNENDSAVRQGLGQFDKNNFIMVTSNSTGSTITKLANHMQSLGCKTAVNLDGGGSTNLFYKDRNNVINNFRISSRKIADIIYFVEK